VLHKAVHSTQRNSQFERAQTLYIVVVKFIALSSLPSSVLNENKTGKLGFNHKAKEVSKKGKKVKSEHLYSDLHGVQTTSKRSGMDHTDFNLQKHHASLYLVSVHQIAPP